MSESSSDPEKSEAPSSLWSSLLNPETTQKAWGLWDAVKSDPRVQQANQRLHDANQRLQQAQQQAHAAWENYDSDSVKEKLANLGKSAAEYIDGADRKLEALENEAVHYLQERGTEVLEKAKEVGIPLTAGDSVPERAEVLYTGPERTTTSRLDAELMTLHTSPDRFLEKLNGDIKESDKVSTEDRQNLLASSADLNDTFKSLVPRKLSESEFWDRYAALKSQLVAQDKRRKQLIENQGRKDSLDEEDKLDDWGSSDEEEGDKTPGKNEATIKKDAASKKIQEEGSDDDWE